MSSVNNSQVPKRTFCINLVLCVQNMTCPSCLYSYFYCSRNADNFQACPRFTYSTLCSCLHKGVFLQFRDIFWKEKNKLRDMIEMDKNYNKIQKVILLVT